VPGFTPASIVKIAQLMSRAWWPPTRWFPLSYEAAAAEAGVDAGVFSQKMFARAATEYVKSTVVGSAERAAVIGAIETTGGSAMAAEATGIMLATETAEATTMVTIGGITVSLTTAIALGLVTVIAVIGGVVLYKYSGTGKSSAAAPTPADSSAYAGTFALSLKSQSGDFCQVWAPATKSVVSVGGGGITFLTTFPGSTEPGIDVPGGDIPLRGTLNGSSFSTSNETAAGGIDFDGSFSSADAFSATVKVGRGSEIVCREDYAGARTA
jgi:hypothetical protein